MKPVDPSELNPTVSDTPLYDMMYGCLAFPAIVVAEELGVYAILAEQPQSIEALAAHLKLTPRAVEAMLTVSAATGFLQSHEDGTYSVTDQGRTYLLPGSPFTYAGNLTYAVSLFNSSLYEAVKAAILRDEPPHAKAVQAAALNTEEVRKFIELMHAHTLPAGCALAEHRYFDEIRTLLDVGAGSCSITCALAAKRPAIHVTALDIPPVCELARETLQKYGVSDRVTLLPGDMFAEALPGGHDAHLYSNIFHDWDLASCRKLAANSFDSLEPGGLILLCEMPIADTKDGPLHTACANVTMLLHEKGKQYSVSEFKDMLEGAGFIDFASEPIMGYYQLISARKPA